MLKSEVSHRGTKISAWYGSYSFSTQVRKTDKPDDLKQTTMESFVTVEFTTWSELSPVVVSVRLPSYRTLTFANKDLWHACSLISFASWLTRWLAASHGAQTAWIFWPSLSLVTLQTFRTHTHKMQRSYISVPAIGFRPLFQSDGIHRNMWAKGEKQKMHEKKQSKSKHDRI